MHKFLLTTVVAILSVTAQADDAILVGQRMEFHTPLQFCPTALTMRSVVLTSYSSHFGAALLAHDAGCVQASSGVFTILDAEETTTEKNGKTLTILKVNAGFGRPVYTFTYDRVIRGQVRDI